MSDTQFHETRLEQTFYEVTMRKLVGQLAKLIENLEGLVKTVEQDAAGEARPTPADAS